MAVASCCTSRATGFVVTAAVIGAPATAEDPVPLVTLSVTLSAPDQPSAGT